MKSAQLCFESKIDTLYVLARGHNIPLAQWVVEQIEKKGIYVKQKEWEFKVRAERNVESYVGVLARIG